MSSIQVKPPHMLNVKSLREYLDSMEALWSEEDIKYLGEFDLTPLRCVYAKGQGIGDARVLYAGGLGFIFIEKEDGE